MKNKGTEDEKIIGDHWYTGAPGNTNLFNLFNQHKFFFPTINSECDGKGFALRAFHD